MARVKVKWTELTTYEEEFEVDGFDPGNASEQLENDVIPASADYGTVSSVDERTVIDWQIVREGEVTPVVVAPRKVYEEDF